MTINQEFEDGPNRTTYILDSEDYTTESWNNYINALNEGITIEENEESLPNDINTAIDNINNAKNALNLDLFNYNYNLTDNEISETSIDSASYNSGSFITTYTTYERD